MCVCIYILPNDGFSKKKDIACESRYDHRREKTKDS